MINQVERGLFDFRAGLLLSQLKEVERELAKETYRALGLGNVASLAVAFGMDDEEIEAGLCEEVHKELIAAINDPKGEVSEKHRSRGRDCIS